MEEIAVKIAVQIKAGLWSVQLVLFECQIYEHVNSLNCSGLWAEKHQCFEQSFGLSWRMMYNTLLSVTNFGREDGNLLLS